MVSIETLILLLSLSTSLSFTPKTLTKSNNTVCIRWSGVESPSYLDWLGIYSPPDSDDDDFIRYLFLNSSSYLTGSGSISLPLTNLRSNYAFRIFCWTRDEVNYRHHDEDNNPLLITRHKLAVSEEIRFESASGPEQIHLAFTDWEDEMRVMFIMGDGVTGSVRCGLEKGERREEIGQMKEEGGAGHAREEERGGRREAALGRGRRRKIGVLLVKRWNR